MGWQQRLSLPIARSFFLFPHPIQTTRLPRVDTKLDASRLAILGVLARRPHPTPDVHPRDRARSATAPSPRCFVLGSSRPRSATAPSGHAFMCSSSGELALTRASSDSACAPARRPRLHLKTSGAESISTRWGPPVAVGSQETLHFILFFALSPQNCSSHRNFRRFFFELFRRFLVGARRFKAV